MNRSKKHYFKYKRKYESLLNQLGGADLQISIDNEVFFWGNQMLEHAIFMSLGLEPNESKQEACKLFEQWKRFMEDTFIQYNKAKDQIFIRGLENTNIDIKKLNTLLDETILFIDKVQQANVWSGWLYPSLLQHMKEETEYFKGKVNNRGKDVKGEIEYIIKHHMEEIGVTAKLLDPNPSNKPLTKLLESYAEKAMSMNMGINMTPTEFLKISGITQWDINKINSLNNNEPLAAYLYSMDLVLLAEDLGPKIKEKTVKSIIPILLGKHVLREFIYFTYILYRYVNSKVDDSEKIIQKLFTTLM